MMSGVQCRNSVGHRALLEYIVDYWSVGGARSQASLPPVSYLVPFDAMIMSDKDNRVSTMSQIV